jgi:hypothetical protein
MKRTFGTRRATSVPYDRSDAGVAAMTLGLSDTIGRYRAGGHAVAEDHRVDESGKRTKRSPKATGGPR